MYCILANVLKFWQNFFRGEFHRILMSKIRFIRSLANRIFQPWAERCGPGRGRGGACRHRGPGHAARCRRRRRISLSCIMKMTVKEEKEKTEKSKTLRYCVIHYCVVQPTCSYITLILQNNRRLHTFLKTRQMGIRR